jgi:hypothetical protein
MKILVTNPTDGSDAGLARTAGARVFRAVIVRNPLWLPTETREQVDLVQAQPMTRPRYVERWMGGGHVLLRAR